VQRHKIREGRLQGGDIWGARLFQRATFRFDLEKSNIAFERSTGLEEEVASYSIKELWCWQFSLRWRLTRPKVEAKKRRPKLRLLGDIETNLPGRSASILPFPGAIDGSVSLKR